MATMTDGETVPVRLSDADGRQVLLKWHVLRRQAADVPFDLDNLRLGLEAGASVEIDIQTLADDDWVVLHDDTLDIETTGAGPVAALNGPDAKHLSMRDPTTGKAAAPVALLADMTTFVAERNPAQGFVLQLDLKAPSISPRARARFVELVAPIAEHCILSGSDWDDVRELGQSIDGLQLGYDPIEMMVAAPTDILATPEATIAFSRQALSIAPQADWIYLYHRLVIGALDAGIDLIAEAHALGQRVDVWTLDPDGDAARSIVDRVVALGVDQITTNDAVKWQALWLAPRS